MEHNPSALFGHGSIHRELETVVSEQTKLDIDLRRAIWVSDEWLLSALLNIFTLILT